MRQQEISDRYVLSPALAIDAACALVSVRRTATESVTASTCIFTTFATGVTPGAAFAAVSTVDVYMGFGSG